MSKKMFIAMIGGAREACRAPGHPAVPRSNLEAALLPFPPRR